MLTIPEWIVKWRNKEITGTVLMRLLVSHKDWTLQVSEAAAAEMLATNAASRLLYNRDPQGVNRLMIFSSSETFALYRERSGQKGEQQHILMTNGVWVFRLALEGIDQIWIDPLTADDILYSKDQFSRLKEMSAAVEVEEALTGLRKDTAPPGSVKLVKDYPAFWVPVGVHGESMRLMLAPDDQERKLAAVFTSEDTLAAFLPKVRAYAAPDEVVERILTGADLFPILATMPIDGMVFNCDGPITPVAFAKAFAQVVAEA